MTPGYAEPLVISLLTKVQLPQDETEPHGSFCLAWRGAADENLNYPSSEIFYYKTRKYDCLDSDVHCIGMSEVVV